MHLYVSTNRNATTCSLRIRVQPDPPVLSDCLFIHSDVGRETRIQKLFFFNLGVGVHVYVGFVNMNRERL